MDTIVELNQTSTAYLITINHEQHLSNVILIIIAGILLFDLLRRLLRLGDAR